MASVAVIILAAGKGSRMGGPKLLLEIHGKTFGQNILDSIRELDLAGVVTVVPPDLASDLKGLKSAIVVNPRPERGMLSSLYVALGAAPNADGYLLIPVDHPYVRTSTYRKLMNVFSENPTRIIKPTFEGRSGHPVIIPQHVTVQIPASDTAGGLQAILQRSETDIIRIAVDDPGILRNVNEPTDLL